MGIQMTYADDILKKNEKPEDIEKKKDIEAKRKATADASKLIIDARGRYLKAKLKKRSIKQALSEDAFAELAPYGSEEDIRNDYGYDFISEAECDRLIGLWEMREKMREQRKSQEEDYHDYVTDLLDEAMRFIYGKYEEEISLYDEAQRKKRKQAEQFAREINERKWKQEEMKWSDS